MQARLPTDRQAAGTSNRNPHEGKTDTPLDRPGKEHHYRRLNAKPSRLTRENENAHDLFGYKKSTQENPCAINIDTLWGQTQLRNASAGPNAGKQQQPNRNSPEPDAQT